MFKKLFIFIFLSLFCFLLLVHAGDIPKPQGFVNDFANVISEDYKNKLTNLIQEVEQKTSAEIFVVTINSIAPYDEKEYARMLFDNWKPGKKGKDNGVLVLLAIKERRWRIETGYGVEGILPDGLCGEIGRNYMVPYFKDAKYSEGLYFGVSAISSIIAKNSNVSIKGAAGKIKRRNIKFSNLPPVVKLILIVLLMSVGALFLAILKAMLLENFMAFIILYFFVVIFLRDIIHFSLSFVIILFVIILFIRWIICSFVGMLPSEIRRKCKMRPKKGGFLGGWYDGSGGGFGGGGFGGGGGGGGGGAGGGF